MNIAFRCFLFLLSIQIPEINLSAQLNQGYVSQDDIQAIEHRLSQNDPITKNAYEQLIQKASSSLSHEPKAVQNYHVPGYYGENQDEHLRMKKLLSDDSAAAFHLSLAAILSDQEQEKSDFAAQAIRILDNWATLNKEVSGADGKLVMCYNGTAFIFAADILDQMNVWESNQRKKFQTWVQNVLNPASKIKMRDNNWACWGIMASLASNRFLQDQDAFDNDVIRLKEIIDSQIETDGSMPHEIKRGKRSLWYTYFALAPMTVSIDLVRRNRNENLFLYKPPSGGTVEDAIHFFFEKGLVNQKQWPVKIKERINRSEKYATLMYAMGRIYQNEKWQEFAVHPTWRDRGGLSWITPSLIQPKSISSKN